MNLNNYILTLIFLFTAHQANAQGTFLGSTGDFPADIAVDDEGYVYTANKNSNNVTKISPDGISTTLGETGESPCAIELDNSGNVFTANCSSNNVSKITPSGDSSIIGETGEMPVDIALDDLGNLYTINVNSKSVTKISPDGSNSEFFVDESNPTGIVVDIFGNIYVSDLPSATKISPDGTFSSFLATEETSLYSSSSIATDNLGNVFISTYNAQFIMKISADGTIDTFEQPGFWITDIAVDSLGNIFTASRIIYKTSPNGISTTIGPTNGGPTALAIDANNNIYVASGIENKVSKIPAFGVLDSDEDGSSNYEECLEGPPYDSNCLDSDNDGIPNFQDTDDDNDGVLSAQEKADRTNPLDSGSFIEDLGDEACVEWNGYLSFLSQILELRHSGLAEDPSSSELEIEVSLYNLRGQVESTLELSLNPGIPQFDIILNDLKGFIPDSYGLVCAKIISGPASSLSGQLSTYNFSNFSYKLAYTTELTAPKSGPQHLGLNTFNPNTAGIAPSWIQLINNETTAQSGSLVFYNQQGEKLEEFSKELTLQAKERVDIPAHELGESVAGMISWEPEDTSSKFYLRQNRYYLEGNSLDSLITVGSFYGKRGSGSERTASIDKRKGFVVAELHNTLSTNILFTLKIFDHSVLGNKEDIQLIIPAKGTVHLVLNQYFETELGIAKFSSNKPESLIVNLINYGQDNGSLLFVNPSSPLEANGEILQGSYNSFLGQSCSLIIAGTFPLPLEISMKRFDGTSIIDKEVINSSMFFTGPLEIDICGKENIPAYGEVTVKIPKSKFPERGVVAQILRSNAEGNFQFSSQLKPVKENNN